jgi:hypothetical protein
MVLVGMSARGKDISDQERNEAVDTIASESAPVWQSYMNGSEVTFELTTNLETEKLISEIWRNFNH